MFFNPVIEAGVTFTSQFAARRTVVQSIPINVPTKVEFNVEDYDNNAEYDHVTNYRWTCKKAGVYHIDTCIGISGLSDGEALTIQVKQDGTTTVLMKIIKVGSAGLSNGNCVGDILFAVDDYIEVYVTHNMDDAKDTGINENCRFNIHRVT